MNPGSDRISVKLSGTLRFFTTSTGHWTIICFGLLLRISQFLFNRSLTEGEAPLALNIIERSFSQLAEPLDYVQIAPLGFLVSQKAITMVFGTSEYALRLLPLLAGLLAMILFYFLAKKTIDRKAIPFALILFASCDHLIYFSSEMKQYSTDVLCSLVLLIIIVSIIHAPRKRLNLLLLGGVGAITFWFSHPALLTYSAGAILLVWFLLREKQWHTLVWHAVAQGIAIVSFTILFYVSLKSTSQNQAMLSFWQPSFMPFPPLSLREFLWLPFVLLRMFKFPGGFSYYELLPAVVAFIIGYSVIFNKKQHLHALLSLPIIVTLVASALHKYPFEGRLLLFLTPLLLIPIAAGIEHIRVATIERSSLLATAFILVLLAHPVGNAWYRLIRPRAPEELRPVMEYVDNHHEEGDGVYVYYASLNAFHYYRKRFAWTEIYHAGIEARSEWQRYFEDIKNVLGKKRVWILLSHIATHQGVDEEQLFVTYLDMLGTQRDAYRTPGAAAYLYDLDTLSADEPDY